MARVVVKNCHPVFLLYPDETKLIKSLLVSEANFAEICDDYCLIAEEIRKSGEESGEKNDAAFNELKRLRADLECEIKSWLFGGT